jgi:hypothetical protein
VPKNWGEDCRKNLMTDKGGVSQMDALWGLGFDSGQLGSLLEGPIATMFRS